MFLTAQRTTAGLERFPRIRGDVPDAKPSVRLVL